MGKSPTLWNRSFIFLNLSFFLVFTNIAFLYLYPLAIEEMGGGHEVVGLVMGLFSLAAVISRPFLGKLVVAKGEYFVISAGMALSLVGSLGYILITKFGAGMLVIRAIHGIGFSAYIAAGFSIAAKAFLPEKRGVSFSILGASLLSAVALAPPFGEMLISKWSFPSLYIAASASIILAWGTASVSVLSLPRPKRGERKSAVRYLQLLKNRSFFFLLISTLIFAHCQSTVPNFLALIATQKGVSSGRYFFTSYLVAIITLLTVGKLIDQYGKLLFMRFFYPFLSIGILFIPGMINSSFLPVSALLYGVGIGVLFTTHNALAADHGRHIEKPAIMSLFTAVYDTGFITGAVVSGWIAAHSSLDMLFIVTGILGLFGFLTVILSPIKDA